MNNDYIIDTEFEEMKKLWYDNEGILFEIIKTLNQRETTFIHYWKKGITHRCIKSNAVRYLKMNFDRYNFLDEQFNLYGSLAKYPQLPVFSFSHSIKRKQMDEFNNNYLGMITEFDFMIDVDNKNLDKAYDSAKRVKTILDKYGIPYWMQFSVSGDTYIMIKIKDNIKLIKIKEAFKLYKKNKNIKILSLNKNKFLEFSKIYDSLKHRDYLYNIYYSKTNIPIKITKHHSLMFLDKNLDIVEKKIGELKEDDYLITFNNSFKLKKENKYFNSFFEYKQKKHEYKIEFDNNLAELVGFYLGDGFLSENTNMVGITLNIKEVDKAKRLQKLILRMKNIHSVYNNYSEIIKEYKEKNYSVNKIYDYLNKKVSKQFIENVYYGMRKKLHEKTKSNMYETKGNVRLVTFFSKPIVQFIKYNFGKYAHKKRLPDWIFEIPKDKVLSLLRGYIETDGHVSKYGVSIKSVSFELITQFIWLLKYHGISSSIYYEKSKPHKMPDGSIFKGSEVYILKINRAILEETKYHRKRNKFSPNDRDSLLPTKKLFELYKKIKPYGVEYNRKIYMSFKKELANKNRILDIINWFFRDAKKNFDFDDIKIINKYFKLMVSDIGIYKIRKIEKTNKKEDVYDFSVKSNENFFAGNLPILAHNSGKKGFHFRVDYQDFPDWVKRMPFPKVSLFLKRFAENFSMVNNFSDIDLGVFDLRRISKTPYSVVYPYYFVALPLSDKQFDNFDIEMVSLPNCLMKIDSYKKIGSHKRIGNSDNVSNLFKDYMGV